MNPKKIIESTNIRIKKCCVGDICKYQIQYKNPKKKTIFNFINYEEWLPYIQNDKWFYDSLEEINKL